MKQIYTEKIIGAVSGAELKAIILKAAHENEEDEEPDLEAAVYFYKEAEKIDVNARYIKESIDTYYKTEKA